MLLIEQDGASVANGAELTGNPAVVIAGDAVIFTNRSGGSITGYPAIAIRGAGVTIVNEAGALIRGAPDPDFPYRFLAIDGSAYADTIINYGKIINDIELRGGDDRYEVFVTSDNNVQGNPVADLGEGDDTAVFHLSGVATLWGVDAEGGAGFDTLVFDGISSTFIQPNGADSFERLVFTGTGSSSYVSLAHFFGAKEILLSPGLTLMLGNGSTRGRNPEAKIYLQGGHLELSSTHSAGEVFGTDADEKVQVKGTLTGSVMTGGGDDQVSVQGLVGGGVFLGAGDDVLEMDGTFSTSWSSQGSVSTYTPAGTIAGAMDGGEGNDTVYLFAVDGRTFDVSAFVGFERVIVPGSVKGDVRLTSVGSVQSVVVSADYGTRVSIGSTVAPDFQLLLGGYAGRVEIVVEAGTVLGSITRDVPLYLGGSGGDRSKDLIVRNEGTIAGDVNLWVGNDYFDGRLGSVGGIVNGLAGDDTILLGAGADVADGGWGNDLLEGNDGADILSGGWGNDVLRGGAGADQLNGGFDSDRLYGGDGDDTLTANDGLSDSLSGGNGNDVLALVRQAYSYDPAGAFVLDGGEGDDRFLVSTGYGNRSHVDVQGGNGADRVEIEQLAGTAHVRLGGGADVVFMDVFINGSYPGGTIRFLDFTVGDGGDRLDLADRPALRGAFMGWDGSSDLFASGLLRLVQRGQDVYLEGKVNGWPGFTTLAVFSDADARSFTAANFSGHAPVIVDPAEVHSGTDGADSFAGGDGDDIYLVNHAGDTVMEYTYSDTDEVRTSLSAYKLPEYVERLTGTSDLGQDLRGNFANNVITAGAGSDFLGLQEGGNDVVRGGAGNDGFYFGAALTAADLVDGGEGAADQLAIQGNYRLVLGGSNLIDVETLAILSSQDNRFGGGSGSASVLFSYDITTVDANVSGGTNLIVNANKLVAGESLVFDGSAETDGSFTIFSGFGDNILTGGAGNDGFFFGEGDRFSAADSVNGGLGNNDQLGLRGNYSTQLLFDADTIQDVEVIALLSARDVRFGAEAPAYSYSIKTADENVAAGARLTVTGAQLASDERLTFDGSSETNGSFRILGGRGSDALTGGAQADMLYGGLGADTLWGGAGDDVFLYRNDLESTSAARDGIQDFSLGDLLDLSGIDAISGTSLNDAFSFVGSSAFSGQAGELRVENVTASGWLVQADVDGNGVADLELLVVVTNGHTLGQSDFML